MQEALYAKNPHNVVRLILGKQFPEDSATDNRYTRSARDFKEWRRQRVLNKDNASSFYVYSQEYEYEGQKVVRNGFFARVGLEEFSRGNICPHEFTLAKAKQDRAQLIRACRANFSPVFGLFSDPSRQVDARLQPIMNTDPIGEVTADGVLNRLWRITDPETLEFLSASFADKKVYIADGHHRYETALGYWQEYGQEVPESRWVLMFLTNLDAEGLAIYPIHRQVKLDGGLDGRFGAGSGRQTFESRLREFFDIEPQPKNAGTQELLDALSQAGQGGIAFAACFGGGDALLLKLKDPKGVIPHMPKDDPQEIIHLGVYQLHTLALNHILGVDTKTPEGQACMNYNVRSEEARKQVDEGLYDLVFLMNPTPIEQVRAMAEKGIRLPQKATYFYPKLLSGFVINPFEW